MTLIKFPGLIDVHVHLREPGGIQKEDFDSGTKAAVTGGFTSILDMPNNPVPTVTVAALEEKIRLADEKGHCFVGFHFGTDGANMHEFPMAWEDDCVFGLKIYGNHTTGTLLIENQKTLDTVFAAWKTEKPILVHAEGEVLERMITLAVKHNRLLHVCHVAKADDVHQIRSWKGKTSLISSGVTPHHLYLTVEDRTLLGPFALMKPELGTKGDRDSLWEGLLDGTIDLVESDHAPHTKEEKESANPPYGVPGLETTLGLLLSSVHEKRITLEHVEMWLYTNPAKIFTLVHPESTYIEFDPDIPYVIGEDGFRTKSGWSPFSGREGYGRVKTVVINGMHVLENFQFTTV